MSRIDREFLKQYARIQKPNKPNVLHALIDRFLITCPLRLEKMKVALETHYWTQFQFESHAMKNSTGMVGATGLTEFCNRLEAFPEEHAVERALKLFPEFVLECEAVMLELKELKEAEIRSGIH